ncbi:dynein axonemal heavy chain 9-like [Anolis sagrei]|uniref:dynein axonemal heavy chain 9-like n=1 Tax=Anolis sagrei TaxID=38937 RepID=UPI0035203C56
MLLLQYQEKLYMEWLQTVSEKSQYNLNQPLIRRDPESRQIAVNFNPQLVSVLREVKYLGTDEFGNIPETAAAIYSSRESFRQLVANLELMVTWYNKILGTVLEVEYPLVQSQLQAIDIQLREAEETLNWKTEGLWDRVSRVVDSVRDLEQRIQKTKDNIEEIQNIMKSWVFPVFERKDGKKESLLYLDERHERLDRHYRLITDSGHKIHFLIKENLRLFVADPASDVWNAYLEHVDEMVLDGFFNVIECSLKYLLENTDPKAGLAPLFKVQLDLSVPEMVFHPSLDAGASDSFYDLVEALVNDIFRVSSLMPRLVDHSAFPHYQADMEEMADLADMRHTLMDRMQKMISVCSDYRSSFDHYSYLYVDDKKEFLRQFLLYGHVLTPEEIELHAENDTPESPPTLQQFKEQIDSYEKIYMEVSLLEPVRIFDSWMNVDARPFKASLLGIIKKWSFMLKQHLIDHVTHSLADLEEFIKVAERGLSKEAEKGDYEALVEIMGHLLAVKDRQTSTDEMFEPLKQTIELLKVYEQELPLEAYRQLEQQKHEHFLGFESCQTLGRRRPACAEQCTGIVSQPHILTSGM